jgi:putative hydrolase of the HAD superfamily
MRLAPSLTGLINIAPLSRRAPMPPELAHIDTWICDLDNTLYPASADLFALIDIRMGQFIQNLHGVNALEARRIQKDHFRDHGTTLAGLTLENDIDPCEFLAFVHDIPLDRISPDPQLKAALARLPGRKLVFTNGDAGYASRVLAALGLAESFETVFDIHACALIPKPDPRPYALLCDQLAVEPSRALFIEDMARNLKPAKAIGMKTVWINNGSEQASAGNDRSFIDYEIECASAWLNQITGDRLQ